jgi:predicted DNA-binding protein (UPF0251 family)
VFPALSKFSTATRVAADHFRKPGRIPVVEMCEANDYRAALVLRDLEGLSVQQTAKICGCSVATAKIRIHRGRERLRKALQQQCDFYRDGESVLRCDRKS